MPSGNAYNRSRIQLVAFTLIEVVVALAVLLIIAAVSLPALAGYLDQQAVEQSAARLATVRDALYNPAGGAFRQTVGGNAGRLSQLLGPIVDKNANYLDSCGGEYSKKQAGGWVGPYVNFNIDATFGMASPIGIAQDVLTRIPPGGGAGNLRINFPNNVEESQAQLLDQLVDGGNGDATGTVQWVLPAVNGQVTLYYFVPIDASC